MGNIGYLMEKKYFLVYITVVFLAAVSRILLAIWFHVCNRYGLTMYDGGFGSLWGSFWAGLLFAGVHLYLMRKQKGIISVSIFIPVFLYCMFVTVKGSIMLLAALERGGIIQ